MRRLVVVVRVSLSVFLGKSAPCNSLFHCRTPADAHWVLQDPFGVVFLAARAIVEERIALARRTLAVGGCPTRGEMNPQIPGMLANQLSYKRRWLSSGVAGWQDGHY